MKLWIDDVRPAPERYVLDKNLNKTIKFRPAVKGYVWCKSVNETIKLIEGIDARIADSMERGHNAFLARDYKARNEYYSDANKWEIELIDIDHDAGDYASDGGDYIRILDYLESTGRSYPIRIHSMNPVGVENMRRIIERNGWKEVK